MCVCRESSKVVVEGTVVGMVAGTEELVVSGEFR